jgi:hypothetical protein
MLLHILQNPMMLYFWAFYAVILGMFWRQWFGACYSYVTGGQAPRLAFQGQGYLAIGLNTSRGGVMYQFRVGN